MAAVTDVNYALTPDQHARQLRRAVRRRTVGTRSNGTTSSCTAPWPASFSVNCYFPH